MKRELIFQFMIATQYKLLRKTFDWGINKCIWTYTLFDIFPYKCILWARVEEHFPECITSCHAVQILFIFDEWKESKFLNSSLLSNLNWGNKMHFWPNCVYVCTMVQSTVYYTYIKMKIVFLCFSIPRLEEWISNLTQFNSITIQTTMIWL